MAVENDQNHEKTLIAVLASYDDENKNNNLARLFDEFCNQKKHRDRLDKFHFIFTGGTFDRIISQKGTSGGIHPIGKKAKDFLLPGGDNRPRVTRLPSHKDGGVTILSNLIVQRKCNIIWPFFTPQTAHWTSAPENLALMRLCDQWHVKRLMNRGSVREWFKKEANMDAKRNRQKLPLSFELGCIDKKNKKWISISAKIKLINGRKYYKTPGPKEKFSENKKNEFEDKFENEEFSSMTIALIAHDEMKTRMVDFAIDYEPELDKFGCITTTGTTGRVIEETAHELRRHKKIYRVHSGPKGGDIQIATDVLYGNCHVVIFFVDPLNPHPHLEDIRTVFGACMIQDTVRMLTNEIQAREWMDRVVKKII